MKPQKGRQRANFINLLRPLWIFICPSLREINDGQWKFIQPGTAKNLLDLSCQILFPFILHRNC